MSTPPPKQKLSLLTRVLAGIGIAGMLLGVLSFTGMVYARAFVVEPFRIPSGGMAPSYPIGSRFLAWKQEVPVRGDVIVFRYPLDPSVNYVQRIVGVGGDRISVQDNRPIVNGITAEWGEEQSARFVDDRCRPHEMVGRTETLGGRSYPVMINRGLGGALADREEVVVPAGHFFTMGDNRDNSEDSRRFGSVPPENVRGIASDPMSFDPPC